MWQSKRLGALNKFKAGECNILICTDVASRGLDIPSVDMVINYDIPTNSKVRFPICTNVTSRGLLYLYRCDDFSSEYSYLLQDYIHRVGRTARAGRSGVAISLVNQYELEWYIQIEKLIGRFYIISFAQKCYQWAFPTLLTFYFVSGKKLPEFPAQEEEVLLLLERVMEAKRLSIMVLSCSCLLCSKWELIVICQMKCCQQICPSFDFFYLYLYHS